MSFEIELHIAIKGANMHKNPTTVMKTTEKEEDQNIEKQMQELNLEKSELDFKRENYQKEKYDFEHSSLGRSKKYNFSVRPLIF